MEGGKNFYWIDNAKAIGIVLVVLGHTHSLRSFLQSFIYSFHIPLFFFLTGFLLKQKYLEMKFRLYFEKYFRKLIVPYLFFGSISYFLWVPTNTLRSKAAEFVNVSFYDPILGIFFGAYNKLYINEPLWFFTCLFSTLLLTYFITLINDARKEACIIVLLVFVGFLLHKETSFRLPWNIDLSMIAIVFLWLGNKSSKLENVKVFDNKLFLLVSLLLLTAISCVIVNINGYVNMNRMIFHNLFLYFIGAFSGIGIALVVSKLIPINIISVWLSKNTIIIFPMHKIIFNIFEGIGVVFFGMSLGFKSDTFFAVCFVIGALIGCIPVSIIVYKYFPWIIGKTSIRSKLISADTTSA